MNYPQFYDKVEKFVLFDELSSFLGATVDGKVEISYLDCVKLAGHSCPTVAGSYIIAKEAKRELEITKRSAVKISFKEPRDSGVTGVIGSVIGYIFGCSDDGGFSGIGGKFNRKNLLSFGNSTQDAMVEFECINSNKKVGFNLDTSVVPTDSQMPQLMQKSLGGLASSQELKSFQELWQGRVENMLLNKELWDKIAKKI